MSTINPKPRKKGVAYYHHHLLFQSGSASMALRPRPPLRRVLRHQGEGTPYGVDDSSLRIAAVGFHVRVGVGGQSSPSPAAALGLRNGQWLPPSAAGMPAAARPWVRCARGWQRLTRAACQRRAGSAAALACSVGRQPVRLLSKSPSDTALLASALAEEAKAGECYCLTGDVGSGKSVFWYRSRPRSCAAALLLSLHCCKDVVIVSTSSRHMHPNFKAACALQPRICPGLPPG